MNPAPTRVRTGLDRLLADTARCRHLGGARVGLLTHAPAVDASYRLSVDALLAAGVRIERLFGPEHGVRGTAQDMIAVDGAVDPISGIPTVSLYGSTLESLTPTPSELEGLDLLIIDLVDIGSRYYTYVYTAALAAQAATRAGLRVLILDRPNPLGGAVEGNGVERGFTSFVGMLEGLPARHGLTLAEVVVWARDIAGWEIDAEFLLVDGWQRTTWHDETGLPWVLPSPNMPTLDTATVYPGQCLFEGTQLSEGRGTTRPFELVGAPWIDAIAWARALEALDLPGCIFRPLAFEPTFQKHARTLCQGLQIHVTDRDRFLPYRTGAAMIHAAASVAPAEFAWRVDAYEFVDDIPAIDLLFGSDAPRRCIDAGAPFAELAPLLEVPEHARDALAACRFSDYGPWTS